MTVLDATPIAIAIVWCLLIAGLVWKLNRSRQLSPESVPIVRIGGGGLVLTPEAFRRDVMPQLLSAWGKACFCRSSAFKCLTSFDMGSAAALADGQIIIADLIQKRFLKDGALEDRSYEQVQRYVCPQCNSRCQVFWEEFSVNMDRHYVVWDAPPARSSEAFFVVGFYGFDIPAQVPGFRRAGTIDQLVDSVASGEL